MPEPASPEIPVHPAVPPAPAESAKIPKPYVIWRYPLELVNHFLTYVPLTLAGGLVLLLLSSLVGEEYGVDKLIWHDDWLKQILVGSGLLLVFTQVLFVGYMLWLRDRRLNHTDEPLEELTFGAFAWITVACLLAAAFLVLTIVGLIWLASGGPSNALSPGSAYYPPWGIIFLTLGAIYSAWWRLRPSDEREKPIPGGDKWAVGGLALGCVVAGVLHYFQFSERYPPWTDSYGLPVGALLTAPGVIWLFRQSSCIRKRVQHRSQKLKWFGEWMEAGVEAWQRPRAWLPYLATGFLWVLWVGLILLAFQNSNILGRGAVILGALLTWCLPWSWPKAWTFGLLCGANGIGYVALVTYFTSRQGAVEWWTVMFCYPFYLVLGCCLFAVLIVYAPRAARQFFPASRVETETRKPESASAETSGNKTADQPEIVPAEELGNWTAGVGIVLGWLYLAGCCSCDVIASPIPMLCALLFVVVGAYGFFAYNLRGSSIVVWLVLIVLALLAGGNNYKFRFPEPLAEKYETAQLQNAKLKDMIEADDDLLSKCKSKIDRYNKAWNRQVATWPRFKAVNDWLNQARETRQDDKLIERFTKIRNEIVEEENQAKQDQLDYYEAAETAFLRLLEEGRIGATPYPALGSPLSKSFATDPKALLQIEEVARNTHARINQQHPPNDRDSKPLVLVTVSGGALRSGVWSELVLAELEKKFAAEGLDFPAHVRLITGASGGMFGAAHYVTNLEHPSKRWAGYETNPKEALAKRADQIKDQIDELAGLDAITPLMRQFVFGDTPEFFSPWPAAYDRGKALEAAWRKRFARRTTTTVFNPLDTSFLDLRSREAAGWCPSLVFTPMMVEDGRRLIISNLHAFNPIHNSGYLLEPKPDTVQVAELTKRGIEETVANTLVKKAWAERKPENVDAQIAAFDFRKVQQDPTLGTTEEEQARYLIRAIQTNAPLPVDFLTSPPKGTYSIEGLELFRLFPDIKSGSSVGSKTTLPFQVGTAARMSASFPFFSPAVSLPTIPRRRLVDAGYYDNYGVSFSSAWLFSERNSAWIRDGYDPEQEDGLHAGLTNVRPPRICIIQIRDGVSDAYRSLKKISEDGSSDRSRAVEELFTPLEGLYNARVGSSSFRNDGQLELLTQYFERLRIPFEVVTFEFPDNAAMNWWLSKSEIERLKQAAQNNADFDSRANLALRFLYPPEDK